MKNIEDVYMILGFFVYTISCLIAYMIVKDMINYRFNKKANELKNTFGKEVSRQLQCIKSGEKILKIDLDYVINKLCKKTFLKVFNDAIIEFNKEDENCIIVKEYMLNFEDTLNNYIKKVRKKDDTIKSYLVVMLGQYGISNFNINEFLFECLGKKSVYLRVSTLQALSEIGKNDIFIRSLVYISKEAKYINSKILIDILDEFEGDKDLLNRELLEKFNEFNINIQTVIIEYYRYNSIDTVKEELIDILKNNSTDKEVKISIIKYFTVVEYEKAKFEIIKLLENKDWEFRAICATALGSYTSKDSKTVLIKSISDKNWYVRHNSAVSILKFKNENIVAQILEGNDMYAKEIVSYVFSINNKLSYDDYIKKSRKVECI